jgi:peptidoglycan/LPS O-acetylase OafA/YrhL
MGLLRFLLALSVIVTHSYALFGLDLVPGNIAVESFFIISGFYMAMVLKEKYFKIDNYYKLFITNRFLRIFPLYWIVLLMIIAYYAIDGFKTGNLHTLQLYADNWRNLSPLALVYLVITNIIIIGQEYTCFFTVQPDGAIVFTDHFLSTRLPFFKFIFDIPLWSVSLELMFYIVSPILVKLKNKNLLIFIIALFAIRLLSKIMHLTYDPFIYRLLPYQIAFFLLGILSYKVYDYLKIVKLPKYVNIFTLVYIAAFTLFYGCFKPSESKDFFYLMSVAIVIPFIFELSKNNKTDRYIGELSFPIYICHIIFLDISQRIITHFNLRESSLPVMGILFSIACSAILIKFISRRIEYYRAKRVSKAL